MEFLSLTLLCHKLFKLGDLKVLPVEAKIVVEHLGKYTQYCCLILIDGSFDVDVKQDSICLSSGSPVDQHKSCRIISKFLSEPLYSLYSLNFLVFKDIGQYFKEVRFTTPEEAGDPYTDISGVFIKGIIIVIKEGNKMFLQFSGDDIFVQFLYEHATFILVYLDDTIDLTINVIFEHRLNSHVAAPPLYHIKRPVIRIRRQFIKQSYIASVKRSRIHDQYRHIREVWLHGIQQCMNPDEWKGLPYTRDKNHISRFVRLILHLSDKCRIIRQPFHLV